ncbi:MAG TPA: glycosyltransferase, partial [Flavitalea sp.]|nr:glycosyltransferase [Flavitalea sp.]
MTDTYPLVSIITLNYNQSELTLQLLQSLQQLSYPNIEILVCDMNSRDEESSKLEGIAFRNTKVLFSEINRGFAGGNNWGIQQSNGEYILLLNNDTVVEPNLVTSLLTPLNRSETIAAVSPKIRQFYNREMIEYAGFNPINYYTGRTSSIGYNEVDQPGFNTARETASVHGCAV